MKIELVPIGKVKPNPNNPRHISTLAFQQLVKSIQDFPEMLDIRPIVVDKDFMVLGGNQRLKACKAAGLKKVPIIQADSLTHEQQREFQIRDNISQGDWDWTKLHEDWDSEELKEWGLEEEETEGSDKEPKEQHQKLTDIYLVPPFSVLDTRQGYWQDRKRYWKDLIGDNGESREGTLSTAELMVGINNGVSILDPVLAELVNAWFGLPNCKAFDCFAGDSVFGYVADALGNTFTGIELRQEQADLNNQRLRGSKSKYICDDGQNVLDHIGKDTQDLLFSCPPYFDLEVYSDLPNDASNQGEYKEFIKILDNAFTAALQCLKENRFAVIVVGDVRDNKGFYRGFVDDIKGMFKRNKVLLYNELILVETLGTLPQRVGKIMEHRKIGKCHQNVLVFYKGNPKQIKSIYPKLAIREDGSTDGMF